MDVIRQEFIVEAGQAIVNLGNLKSSLDSVNTSLRNLGSGGGGGATRTFQQGEEAVRRFDNRTKELTVSFQTLTRVFATQVLVSALGQIRRAFTESAEQAFEFQRQVALVQTLVAEGDTASFDGISEAIRNIAAENNIPLLEAAEAAYNALSNQVGDTAQSLQFTAEAAVFARATNSSLADSVDLLSAGLRSYNLDVTETGRLSSLFFTIIDEGRITADEFANSFGRIGPAAANLGVDLAETGAALSVISVRGLATAETLTQFRGILNTLQKPSTDLAAAIQEIGFESAQTAIQSIGLFETLRRLEGTTGGNVEALNRLFPNIRGVGGVISILRTNTDELDRSLFNLRNNTEDFNRERNLIATATDAETVSNLFNRLSIEGTQLGETFIGLGADLINSAGGAEEFTDVTLNLITVLGTAVGTLGLVVGGTRAASLALGTLGGNPLLLSLLAVGGAIGGISVAIGELNQQSLDNINADLNAFDVAAEEARESLRQLQQGSEFDAETLLGAGSVQQIEVLRGLRTQVGDFFADFQIRNAENIQESIRLNDLLVQDTTDAVTRIVDAREDIVDAIQREISSIAELNRESQLRQEDLGVELDDRQFDRAIEGINAAAQVQAVINRAEEQAREAARILESAGTNDEAIQRGLDLFARLQAEAERAEQIARSAQNRGLELQTAERVDSIIRQQIRSEEELQRVQNQREETLRRAAAEERRILQIQRELAQTIIDNSSLRDDAGNEFTAEEQRRRADIVRQAQQELRQAALQSDTLSTADILGIADVGRRLQDELSGETITLGLDIDARQDEIRRQLDESFADLRVEIPVIVRLEEALGRELRNADEVIRGFTELTTSAEGVIQGNDEIEQLELSVEQLRERLTLAAQAAERLGDLDRVGAANIFSDFEDSNALLETFREARQELLGLAEQGGATEEQIGRIARQLAAANEEASGADRQAAFGFIGDQAQTQEVIAQLLQAFQDLNNATAELETRRTSVAELLGGNGSLNELAGLLTETSSQLSSLGANPVTVSFEPTVNQILTAQQQLRILAEQIRNLPTVGVGGPGLNRQFGGEINFFQDGGQARGVDTVPAMLQVGETVTNARSSARFFSQLQAINAGQNPVFRAQNGGNTNIGDINVTVQGGETGVSTARTIATELRRELRRGTSR